VICFLLSKGLSEAKFYWEFFSVCSVNAMTFHGITDALVI
jgi:hypothetical protein